MPDLYREPADETSLPTQSAKIEASVLPKQKEQIIAPEKTAERPPEVAQPAVAPAVTKPVPQSAQQGVAVQPTQTTPAKDADFKEADKDRQLKILVDMAFQQGIDKAVEAAKASGSPYLIDKFHDTLIDELRQQLVEKGKLKEI